MRGFVTVTLAVLLGACAHTSVGVPAGVPVGVPVGGVGGVGGAGGMGGACASGDAHRLRLLVQAVRGREGGRETLRSGDTVRSGDRFHLRMCANQRAWVRLLQVDPTGRAEQLYPMGSAREEVDAQQIVRVPTDDLDIIVDAQVGTEHLIVVASDRPMEDADSALADALVGLQRRRPEESQRAAPREPPAHVPEWRRHRLQAPHGVPATSEPEAADERPPGEVLSAFHPRGLSRRLTIAPSEGEGADVDETTPTTAAEHVVLWRLDLRHVP